MKFTIELGVQVKSNINGRKGKVTSRSEHINGCNRYWVEPKMGKDGKSPGGAWCDEMELIVTEKNKMKKTNPHRGGFQSTIK